MKRTRLAYSSLTPADGLGKQLVGECIEAGEEMDGRRARISKMLRPIRPGGSSMMNVEGDPRDGDIDRQHASQESGETIRGEEDTE